MLSGLSSYTEYRLSVVGVNFRGNAYNSTEGTAWTEEGGTCNISKDAVVVTVVVFFFLCLFIYCVSQVYCKSSIKSTGRLFISSLFEGELNRDGGHI